MESIKVKRKMKEVPVVFKTTIDDATHYYCRVCSQYRPEVLFAPSSIKGFRRRCKDCSRKYFQQLYYKTPTTQRLASLKSKLRKVDPVLARRWEASDVEAIFKVAGGKSELTGSSDGPLCIVARDANLPLVPTNAMCILRKEARARKHLRT